MKAFLSVLSVLVLIVFAVGVYNTSMSIREGVDLSASVVRSTTEASTTPTVFPDTTR
jgi:hypothetical protein